MNTQAIVLTARPDGALSSTVFSRQSVALAPLQKGEVLVRVRLLSIDPYQRSLLDEKPLVGRSVPIGGVMAGRGIGEVLVSRAAGWNSGELALGEFGWREHATAAAANLQKLEKGPYALSWHLGTLGYPGVTAWLALQDIGAPQSGETVLVSSAAGAVGSVVGQVAMASGARVIGVAGGSAKVALLRERLGFDFALDHRAKGELPATLAQLAPEGVDLFFDNVGEEMIDIGLSVLKPRGRVLLCGHVASYDAPDRAEHGHRYFRAIMNNRWRVHGFSVRDHATARHVEAQHALRDLADKGRLRQLETIITGLSSAPAALVDLLAGRHVGKTIVSLD
ncbi:MAG: NADP-dependent oxidoreductase [Burkholderiaceae bacterium]|nr:NADP-dependent oxidoreductase [Burkholderiaceae bacterium]